MSYRGVNPPIILGYGGLNGSFNTDKIPSTDLVEAQNVRFDDDTVRKVGGLSLFNANAITASTLPCLAGLDYWPTVTVQRQITVWSNTANSLVYKEVGGDLDANLIASGLTFTQPVVLVTCGQEIAGNPRKVIMFSQGVIPMMLNADGTAMANIGTNTACGALSVDWGAGNYPMAALMHDRRVVAWGNNNSPHALYFSALNDHTDFAGNSASYSGLAPVYDIMPGEGQYITACYSIGTTRLYIFKYPTGIYMIDTTDVISMIMPVTTVRTDIGCAGPKAITKAGSFGTWFIGTDGHVYSLEMISDPNIDPREASITKAKNLTSWLKDHIAFGRLRHAQLHYDPIRGELTAYYTSIGGTYNDVALVFDVRDPQNIRTSVESRGSYFNAVWMQTQTAGRQRILCAGTAGKVWVQDYLSRYIAPSTGYSSSFRTPDSDFSWVDPSIGERVKRLDWLSMRVRATGSYTIYCDIYIDGSFYGTKTFTIEGSSSTLDDTAYGLTPNTTKADFVLANDVYIEKKIKCGGIGKKFSFRIYNTQQNEDFSIISLTPSFAIEGTTGEK